MNAVWLHNLANYSLQICAIALAGAVAIRLARVADAEWRLRFWQALLMACLLLPVVQPWRVANDRGGVSVTVGASQLSPTAASVVRRLPLSAVAAWLLCTGVAARFGYLGLGLWRLRRYRRESEPASAAALEIQSRLGIAADIRVLAGLPGPVSFGVLRPVILLPPPWAEDEAVLSHELIHVRRRDWVWTVPEECIRAVLWFHPAVWWMLAEMQLAREQAVDGEAVLLLHSRSRYLQTLLDIAAVKAGFETAAASLFLRNRHLRKRVASLMKEAHMSRNHIQLSTAAFVAAILAAGWLVVQALPLQAAPQDQTATVTAAGLRPTHKVSPVYPADAKAKGVEGEVAVRIQVDRHGLVSDAQVISGPEELRAEALVAVRQWTFATDAPLPASAVVSMSFRLDQGEPTVVQRAQNGNPQRIRVHGKAIAANLVHKVAPLYPQQAKLDHVSGAVRLNVLIGADGRVQDVVLIDGQPVLAEAAIDAVRQWEYRPTLLNGEPVEVLAEVTVNFTLTE